MSARALTMATPAPAVAAPAATVTPAAGSVLRRQCACGQHTSGGVTCDECARRKSPLRRKAAGQPQHDGIPPVVDEVLRSGGHGFGGAARAFMESRFARDFGAVRIHTDSRAAESAMAVNALAYTVGNHIVFGTGRYAPETPAGASLLAHELTHVAQNAAGGSGTSQTATIGTPGDAAEVEADRMANAVMTGGDQVQVRQRPTATLHPLDTGEAVGLGVGLGAFGIGVGLAIAAGAGAFDKNDFTDDELREYLQMLAGGKIEGNTDSDNKARALVRRWMTGKSPFALSAPQKSLLIREMQDGRVSDDDRNGIVTLIENTADEELAAILAPGSLDFPTLLADIGKGEHGERLVMQFVRRQGLHTEPHFGQFLDWYATEHFDGGQHSLARKVTLDVLSIAGMDFADATEFRNEIFKRLRASELMRESQATGAFDYPENMDETSGCSDYQAPVQGAKENLANARVNKEARDYWSGVQFDPQWIYFFTLTDEGRKNGFKALTSLFAPQDSICDRTLIHCDYLVSVIQYRTYAETLGEKKFDALVRNGSIAMYLTWHGMPPPPLDLIQGTPKSYGYRPDVRPRTRQDFAIGDQVVFWNHLAFDGLNAAQQSAWRNENAVLLDKSPEGEDLFQGHGTARKTERTMLSELLNQYNALARPALRLADDVQNGRQTQEFMSKEFPLVAKEDGKWVVIDPGRQEARGGRRYDLKAADASNPESEPLLPGLRDPLDLSQFGTVTRPAESQPGKLYRPD